MHKLLLLLSLLFFAAPLCAGEEEMRPLDIVVNFAPPFPREFTAYFNNPSAYSITVTSFADQDLEVYFLAEMRGLTNGVEVRTNEQFRPNGSLTIPANSTIMLTGEDVANLNEGISLNDLIISGLPGGPSINGILPEGMYQFCINAFSFGTEDLVSLSVGCGTLIDINYADQLTVLYPGEGDVVMSNPSSSFEIMWDPNEADPMRRMDIEYELKMIDITAYPDEDLDILLRDGGPQVELDEDMITNEFYLYGMAGTDFELEYGHQYALRVRRVDPEPIPLINDGYSEVRTFWYGEIPDPPDDEDGDDDQPPVQISDCVANCEYTVDFNETLAANTEGITSLEIGNFTIEDVTFIAGTTGPTWRGRGKIELGGWMMNYPLAVEFQGVRINADNRIISGVVTARDDSDATYDLGDLHTRLDAVSGYVPENISAAVNQHVTSLRMIDGLLTGDKQGVPFGFTDTLQGHRLTMMLTYAIFRPRDADVDLLTVVDMTSINPSLLLPLGSRGVCLTPGGFGSEATLMLTEDITAPPLGDMTLSLSGSSRPNLEAAKNEASYIAFDCDGLRELAIRGKVGFPRSVIVPDLNGLAADTGRVRALFEFTLDRNVPIAQSAYAYRAPEPDANGNTPPEPPEGSHMLFGLTMNPFQVAGLEGWTFVVREATMDLSDLENPDGMKFPEGYATSEAVDTGKIWQGFHLKELSLFAPANMRADSQRAAVSLADIIIDPEPSISMNARALNLIDKSIGAMDGWGFSLDTFQLTIVQNTLIDGRLMGKISSPLVGPADYLKYKAIVNQNDKEKYEFMATATPERDSVIRLPMVLAKAGLCPNSFIQFKTTPDTTTLQAFLAGQMTVDVTRNMPDSLQALNILPELSIKFAEFQLNFDNKNGFVTAGEVPLGDESRFGFAVDFQDELCGTNYNGPVFVDTDRPDYDYDVGDLNQIMHDGIPNNPPTPSGGDGTAPQEKLSGFPITIGDTDFSFEGTQVRVDLRLDLHLNGSENHEIRGSASVGMASTLKRDGLKIKKFHIDSVYLSAITVGTRLDPIDLDFMSMYGGVRFVNFSGGKGFQGDLHVTTSADFGFDLKAGFGKAGNSEMGDYGTPEYHGWWYLDGMFRFPAPGIQMGIVGMNGIGGGVYWNCTAPGLTLSIDDVMAAADGSAPTPDAEIPTASFGERTIAFRTLMSLVRPSVLMVEPEIVANWTAGEGLNSLSLNGDFWSLSRVGGFAGQDDLYKTTARLWGETNNTLRIERGDNGSKMAVMGTNAIYANLINNVLFGAGEDRLMVRSAFAVGHRDLFSEYDIGSSNGNTYWFFNVGNPYEGNMGGLRFDLPGFNLDNADGDGDQLGEAGPTAEVGAGVDFYMMAGMNIPNTLPEPPGRITDLFGIIDGHADGDSGGSTENTQQENERDDNDGGVNGLGIVVGAHAFASAEVNAVLYARLAILAGLDFMAFKYPDATGCITESGQEIPEIGINGWYGTGRAYIGLEGELGARGRFMGNEINVRLMHLVAAAMVEAGGPRPMYLSGRLGIYYSLLGGLIEGSARMKINVGSRCQPIGGSPFGFPIIVDSNPNEQNNTGISPLVRPKVSFSVPLTENPSSPKADEIMRVPDTEGNVHSRIAYLHSFTLTPRGGGERADYSRDTNYPFLIREGRAAEYRPNAYISAPYGVDETRRWRMRAVVRARERLEDGRWVDIRGVGGVPYEEVREVDFTTDPLPETMLDEQVGMTKPFRFQHFYLQNDVGHRRAIVYTRQQEENAYFATSNGRINYEFTGVVIDVETGEEVGRNPVTYYASNREAHFWLPELENDREFEIAIIRRATNQLFGETLFTSSQTIKKVGTRADYEAEAINSEYEVNTEVVNIDELMELSPNELITYRWRFRTSEHNTLSEKMAGVNLLADRYNGFQRIVVRGDFEGFDFYDIKGKTFRFDTNEEDEEQFQSEPLVEIADPFTSPFHANQSIPLVGGFVSTYWSEYTNTPTGIYSQMNASISIQMPSFNPSDMGIEGSGLPMPSEPSGGGSTQTFDAEGEIDMDWPMAPEYNHDINYLWSVSRPYAALNERVEDRFLQQNSALGFATVDNDPRVMFNYFVTENVLADAEGLTDFYEYWRDKIMDPWAHVDDPFRVDQDVNIYSPDQRAENMANLEARYLALVNSDLVRRPPATILTLADYEEEEDEDEPSASSSGSSVWGDVLAPPSSTTPFAALSYRAGALSGLTYGGGSSSSDFLTVEDIGDRGYFIDDDDGYSPAIETTRALINGRYGFSNQLRFRAFFPDTGGGTKTERVVPLNN